MAHYRIRLIGGPVLHFTAARCRYEGDVLIFEDERPGGARKAVWEIHTANVDQVIDEAVPLPRQWGRGRAPGTQPGARPRGAVPHGGGGLSCAVRQHAD